MKFSLRKKYIQYKLTFLSTWSRKILLMIVTDGTIVPAFLAELYFRWSSAGPPFQLQVQTYTRQITEYQSIIWEPLCSFPQWTVGSLPEWSVTKGEIWFTLFCFYVKNSVRDCCRNLLDRCMFLFFATHPAVVCLPLFPYLLIFLWNVHPCKSKETVYYESFWNFVSLCKIKENIFLFQRKNIFCPPSSVFSKPFAINILRYFLGSNAEHVAYNLDWIYNFTADRLGVYDFFFP